MTGVKDSALQYSMTPWVDERGEGEMRGSLIDIKVCYDYLRVDTDDYIVKDIQSHTSINTQIKRIIIIDKRANRMLLLLHTSLDLYGSLTRL